MSAALAHSRGFEISYEDHGAGPPIVLVNGYASPAAEWTDVGYVARLVDRYRVLPVDSLGHGQSEKSYAPEDYRLPDAASDIVAAMDAAGVERAALWGYSRGSVLVAIAAAEFPERVAALVLGGFHPPSGEPSDEITPAVEALLRGDWDDFWEKAGADVSDHDRQYMQDASDPRAMGAVDLGWDRSSHTIDAGRITAPTLLYYGSQEPVDSALREKVRAFGKLHVLDGQHDHFEAFSDVDAVMPVVREFLDRVY